MKIVRRNYLVLLFLGLVFAAPGISAYFFYLHPEWLGEATTNKGVLLNPPALLTSMNGFNNTKWQLVLWSPTACGKTCLEQLDKLARVRLALGRHLYEVDSQLLLDTQAPQLSEQLIKALHDQDTHILTLTVGERERIPALQDRLEIFIANPEDYLVLAYQPTVKPEDIYHDIKHLLTK